MRISICFSMPVSFFDRLGRDQHVARTFTAIGELSGG